MGCDIHAVFQCKSTRRWVDVFSKYEGNRHYFLFAWLAGVRNGFGFAGKPSHDPITPIAEPRGLPRDFDMSRTEEHEGVWLGDHSHSWLTADEILAAKLPINGVMRTGVVVLETFKAWDGTSEPSRWCGGGAGKGIVVAASPNVVTPETTHVQIEWPMPSDSLDYFVAEIKRLRDEYGEVRMVFGFDS